ncbi:hypothetical protein J7J41_01455 [bacterium]|nr:hypothetical protein [bacterium]
MTSQKGLVPTIIVLILVALIVGGILVYRYGILSASMQETKTTEDLLKILSANRSGWSSPINTRESGIEWKGTITLITPAKIEKGIIIEAQGANRTIRSFVLPKTIIVDKANNTLSLDNLREGDFVSISGIYRMVGKMTPEWEVVIVAERIKVLGECIGEGEERTSDIWCCPGLTLIEQKYCTKCGDGICKSPENQENCLLDCAEIGKLVTLSILIDVKSFDLDSKTFKGRTHPEGKNVKILTTDSTKFYRTAEPGWQKEYFTFSEFYSLLKNWSGPFYPFTVKGILGERDIIRADEVFMIVQ